MSLAVFDAAPSTVSTRPFVARWLFLRTVSGARSCRLTTMEESAMSNPAKGQHGDGQRHSTMSAKEQKAAEVQEAGSAKADAGHPEVLEGGKAEPTTEGKGHPKSAASNAPAGGTSDAATSSATVGKAEKEAAAAAGAEKDQHGRGHRKSE